MTKGKGKKSEKAAGAAKPEEGARAKSQKENEYTKLPTRVIVRHLPPTITETEFLKQTSPLPAHNDFYLAAPDLSLGANATGRAYITFERYADVVLFKDRFDGYVFFDSRGHEYAAMVEIAPFQGNGAKKPSPTDSEVNTIENDPHFLQFLNKIKSDVKVSEPKLAMKLEYNKKPVVTTTPLLEYLASASNKKQGKQRKRRRERRQQVETNSCKESTPWKGHTQSGGAASNQGNQGKQSSLDDVEKTPLQFQRAECPSIREKDPDESKNHGKKWHGKQIFTNENRCKGKSLGKPEEANQFEDTHRQPEKLKCTGCSWYQRGNKEDAATAGNSKQKNRNFTNRGYAAKEVKGGAGGKPKSPQADKVAQVSLDLKNLKISSKEVGSAPIEELRPRDKDRSSFAVLRHSAQDAKEKQNPSALVNEGENKAGKQRTIWWGKRSKHTEAYNGSSDQSKSRDGNSKKTQNSKFERRNNQGEQRGTSCGSWDKEREKSERTENNKSRKQN